MKMRFLGKTGVRMSELCLGTMPFGGAADETTSAEIYGRARDAGINIFDCANVYNGGRAEEILGELVAGHRDEVVLTTKCYFPAGDGPNERGLSRYHVMQAVEASLRRLQTDRIDLLFLHRFDDITPIEEVLRGVEQLVRDGKVLYPACSNFAAWQTMKALGIAKANGWTPIYAIQPMYNLVKRQAEVELLPMAASEQLGVLPYSPLGAGLLTGKYGSDRRPDTGRLVDNEMYSIRYGEPDYYAVAESFAALADEAGIHPVSLAIAWVAAHPAVTAPILGARSVEQLEPQLSAPSVEMTVELYDRIASLSPAPPPATDRNEEGSGHDYGVR